MRLHAELPAWSEPLFKPKRYKSMRGGRAAGRSWTVARALLIEAARQPLRVFCGREFQHSIKDSVHRLLCDQIELLKLPGYSITQHEIRHVNGSLFLFEGLKHNISKVKSLEGIDRCWIEEAETISEESWAVLIPTIRKPGSEIWLTWNPREEDDPTYRRFVTSPPPDCWSVEVSSQDNPWLPEELKKEREYLYRVDPEAAAHVWGGQTRRISNAQVLRGRYRVEAFEPADSWGGPYYGADWGFAVDPTVLTRSWVSGRSLLVEYEAYGVGVDIDETPKLFGTVPGAREHVSRADSARPETISYMQQHGFPRMEGVTKWAGSVEDGVEHLRSYEEIVIHPRCKHTAEEARLWSYKTDKLSGDVLPVLIDKHNHCLVGDTLIETDAGPVRIDRLVGQSGYLAAFDGDRVRRGAFRDVRMTSANEIVYRVRMTDGRIVIATGDHPFLTADGWTPLLALNPGSKLVDVSDAIRYALMPWGRNTNRTMVCGFAETIEPVTTSIQRSACACIDTCGSLSEDRYLSECTCITETAIARTTPSGILSCSVPECINEITGQKTTAVKQPHRAGTPSRLAPQLVHGTAHPQAGDGIASMRAESRQRSGPERLSARDAAGSTKARSRDDFARMLARLLHDDPRASMTFEGNALHVERNSFLTSTDARRHAAIENAELRFASVAAIEPAGSAPVFNLEVEHFHTFAIASGIVTHNCWDSIRYALNPLIRKRGPSVLVIR